MTAIFVKFPPRKLNFKPALLNLARVRMHLVLICSPADSNFRDSDHYSSGNLLDRDGESHVNAYEFTTLEKPTVAARPSAKRSARRRCAAAAARRRCAPPTTTSAAAALVSRPAPGTRGRTSSSTTNTCPRLRCECVRAKASDYEATTPLPNYSVQKSNLSFITFPRRIILFVLLCKKCFVELGLMLVTTIYDLYP
jgi:hypothetical protein